MQKLRIGVSKAPANAAGRTLLARVYLAYRRPDLAREVLIDGLAYLPVDTAYLQGTLSFLLEFQEDAKLLELTHRMLAAPANPATASLLATFAATAAFYRGNYDEAEDLLARYRLGDTADGALLQARIAWERDYPELALVHLKEHLAVHSQHDAARALLAGSTRAYPEWTSQFAPVLNGLQAVALSGLGRTDEARLSLDHLLARRNLRADNLVAVASRLSNLGAGELALSALARATEVDPLNQAALANLIRLELDTGAVGRLPAHLGQFLHTRQPSHEILSRARAALGSDRLLLLPAQKDLLADLQSAPDPRRP